MTDPAPYVSAKKSSVNSVLYEVTAYVDDMDKKTRVNNELFDLCYRHLTAAGIELRPLGVPAVPRMLEDPREALLRRVDLFSTLNREELHNLAPLLSRHEYEAGAVVIARDTVPDSLTIIESGILTVMANDASGTVEVARLGPGDTLGEAGLLSGRPARVQVSTLSLVIVYRLKKEDLTPLLKRQPEVARQMCELLSKRQDKLSKLSAVAPAAQSEQSVFQWLLDGMRKLHNLTF
jgi:CRP-like cAMP-binding protein